MQPPSITRVVDVLVSEGFATRTQSDEDRRVAWVAPTDEGRALVEAVRRQRDAYLAQRLRTLTAEDRAVLAPRYCSSSSPRTHDDARPPSRHDTFRSLHNRNYRLYFVGQTISVSGTWMQQLAQAVLILQLTNKSGTALGILTALQFLPMLVFGAWGGVIADRFDKRRILFGTQIAAGVLALVMGDHREHRSRRSVERLPLVVPARLRERHRQPRPPDVRARDGRPRGSPQRGQPQQRRDEQLACVGPAIGGVLIAVFGIAPCFYINAASYVAVLVALSMMDTSLLHRLPTVERAKGQLREGLRYAWSERMVRAPLLMMAVIGTLAFNFQVVIPLIAAKTFDAGAGGIALLLSSMGAGAVLGGLSVASRRGVSYRRLITLAMVMGVAILAAAAAPTLATEAIALFAMGASAFAFIAVANTTIQLTAAPEMRGRVMALYAIAFLGSTPIGGPIIGWVSQHYGADRLCDRRDRGDRATVVAGLVVGSPSLRSGRADRRGVRPRRLSVTACSSPPCRDPGSRRRRDRGRTRGGPAAVGAGPSTGRASPRASSSGPASWPGDSCSVCSSGHELVDPCDERGVVHR